MAVWIVQDNLGRSSTAENIKRACLEEEQTYIPIQVVPFSNCLPEMPVVTEKFVLYGRTSLMLGAYNDPKWKQGLFFDPEKFTTSSYVENWGQLMLNSNPKIIKIKDFESLNLSPSEMYFVKPNDDLKMFAGCRMYFNEIQNMFVQATDNLNEPINLETEIVIDSLKEIDREWRLFLVDGKVITGSQYQPEASSFVPSEVENFAEEAAKMWSPAQVFVLDVASTNQGLKIIECNCFNGSGFYFSDLNKIVRIVSKYIEVG